MNKEQIKERFNQVVETIKTYTDSNVGDKEENNVEYAVNVSEKQLIVYSEEENLIRFYDNGMDLLSIDENSPLISMFDYVLGFTDSLYKI